MVAAHQSRLPLTERRRVRQRSFLLAMTMMVLAAASGCAPAPGIAETPPTVVSVSEPIVREVTEFADFPATTDAVESVEIRARVSGYLTAVHFEPGAEVERGTLLFEIDSRPYVAEVRRHEAEIARWQAEVQRATADIKRFEQLLPRGVITQEEFDQAAAAQAVAAASLAGAEAALESAQLNLQFTSITAPIDGRLSRALITEGNLVAADVTLLTTIVTVHPVFAYFDIDERTMLEIQRRIRENQVDRGREGQTPVFLGLANETGFPHQGTLNFVDNRVDPATGTLRVRAEFSNADRVLSPGLFARVRLPISRPQEALLVSERALGIDQGQRFAYVVNDQNQVEYRLLEVGPLQDGMRVIQSGIEPGDRVIVYGLQRVRPGLVVDPQPADMPDVSAAPTADEQARHVR